MEWVTRVARVLTALDPTGLAYRAYEKRLLADLGQGEELEPARKKAELMGIAPENIHIMDVREEFVRDFVFPMFRANACLLYTSDAADE